MGVKERLRDWLDVPSAPAATEPVRLDSIVNTLTGLGGTRDKGAVARPDTRSNALTTAELTALHEKNGISRRIVDCLPDDMMRKGWRVAGLEDAKALEDEEERLGLATSYRHALKMARLHGGALIVPITRESGAPDKYMREPLDLGRVRGIDAVHVFDEDDATPLQWDTDIHSPTYRQPLLWQVMGEGRMYTIHASRLAWLRGLRRSIARRRYHQSTGWPDLSALQPIYDEVQRLTSVSQAGAVVAQELRTSVLRIDGLERMDAGSMAETLTARLLQIARGKSNLGMIVMGKGDEFASHANPPTGFRELSQEAKATLAAVTGIPQVVLFGDSPGGLNSDGASAWQLWDRRVIAEQALHTPHIAWLWRLMLTAAGKHEEAKWSIEWLPLSEPAFGERVEAYAKTAAADAIYLDRGVASVEQIRAARFGEGGWELDVDAEEEPDADDLEARAREALAAIEGAGPEPAPVVEGEGGAPEPLNGMQVQSGMSTLEAANTGRLTIGQAREVLVSWLGRDPASADRMLKDVDKMRTPTEPTEPTGEPAE